MKTNTCIHHRKALKELVGLKLFYITFGPCGFHLKFIDSKTMTNEKNKAQCEIVVFCPYKIKKKEKTIMVTYYAYNYDEDGFNSLMLNRIVSRVAVYKNGKLDIFFDENVKFSAMPLDDRTMDDDHWWGFFPDQTNPDMYYISRKNGYEVWKSKWLNLRWSSESKNMKTRSCSRHRKAMQEIIGLEIFNIVFGPSGFHLDFKPPCEANENAQAQCQIVIFCPYKIMANGETIMVTYYAYNYDEEKFKSLMLNRIVSKVTIYQNGKLDIYFDKNIKFSAMPLDDRTMDDDHWWGFFPDQTNPNMYYISRKNGYEVWKSGSCLKKITGNLEPYPNKRY